MHVIAARLFPLAMAIPSMGLTNADRASATSSQNAPNIVFILTDDQRFDTLGLLHPVLDTPRLDALAADGIRFDNAFVTTPICPSSRASLLTGLYETTHGYTFLRPRLRMPLLLDSYPYRLRQAGYVSGFVGKNGADLDPPRQQLLFDEFVVVDRTPYIQVREGELIHETDFVAKKGRQFIAQHAGHTPFVLTLWFNAPHAEDSDPEQFIPPTRFTDLYADATFPAPANSDPAFFDALPTFLRESENRARWHWRWTPALYQTMMRRYLAMIHGIDAAVGTILDELTLHGVADNTIVVFTSDNGFYIGDRGFADKWLAHESSIRVPLIIHDPRLPAHRHGQVLDAMALNVDLPPTLLALADVTIPSTMQGRSLLPLLLGGTTPLREDFFIEHSFTLPPGLRIPPHRSLRTDRHKYIGYIDEDYEELYDLLLDPAESNNLAGDAAQQPLLSQLRERTRTLHVDYDRVLVHSFELPQQAIDAGTIR